ncbi:hypothetical protein ASPSYDRAFT_41485 [Aspergillus sydowii CBS 593.65]|uniref:Uncharacterized protein n=1 Tax=Aspergillus sydowii CBS 593.65 TaxID=1036612 RepID=A0A1L9TTR3_9EURO|nr:uncharacterized protein ASPSYDRAFT_41485 [Aspergillus sydowii CBS 593.65]OJJ62792.1 hypothetical protein ASPSYDRAFT_41485 [Aspergillus sydowii CBS 593.65]
MSLARNARILFSASNTYVNGSRPLFSSVCPWSALRTAAMQARRNSGIMKDWKGSSGEKHTTHRVEKENDKTDPQTIGASRTMKDREQNFGSESSGQSGAATETGGRKNAEEAKKDHPKAPEPVIGMNDERAGKGV